MQVIFSFQTCKEKHSLHFLHHARQSFPDALRKTALRFSMRQHRNCAAIVSFPISAVIFSAFGCTPHPPAGYDCSPAVVQFLLALQAVVCRGGGFPLRGRAALLLFLFLLRCCRIYSASGKQPAVYKPVQTIKHIGEMLCLSDVT